LIAARDGRKNPYWLVRMFSNVLSLAFVKK
jgi:hypothetical protein